MPRLDGVVFLLGTAIAAKPYAYLTGAICPDRDFRNRRLGAAAQAAPAARHFAKTAAYSDFARRCKRGGAVAWGCRPAMGLVWGIAMASIMLPVTLMTAGACALINLWLAFRTSATRGKAKVSIGDGGDEALIRRMRAHANFVEYAPFILPFILILIGLIEFTTGTALWLWLASAAFLIARVAHPLGMDGLPVGRTVGTLVTFLLLLGLGGYAVVLPLLPHSTTSAPVVTPIGAG